MKQKHFFYYFIILLVPLFPLIVKGQAYEKVGYKQKGKASYYGRKFHGNKTASGERFNMYAMTAAHRKIPFNSVVKVTNLKNGKSIEVRINDRGPFSGSRIIDLSRGAASELGYVNDGTADVRLELVRLPGQEKPKDEDVIVSNKDTKPKPKKGKEQSLAEKAREELRKKLAAEAVKEARKRLKKGIATAKTASSKKLWAKKISKTGFYSRWGTPIKHKGYCVQVGSFDNPEMALGLAKEVDKFRAGRVVIHSGWANKKKVYRVYVGQESKRESARLISKKLSSKGFVGNFIKKF